MPDDTYQNRQNLEILCWPELKEILDRSFWSTSNRDLTCS